MAILNLTRGQWGYTMRALHFLTDSISWYGDFWDGDEEYDMLYRLQHVLGLTGLTAEQQWIELGSGYGQGRVSIPVNELELIYLGDALDLAHDLAERHSSKWPVLEQVRQIVEGLSED